MSHQEVLTLVVVLGVVYAFECLILMPPGARLLHAPWLRRSSLLPRPGSFMLLGRAVLGTNPLPPFGRSHLTCPPPFEADASEVLLAGQREAVKWESIAGPAGKRSLASLRQHLEELGHESAYVSHHLSAIERLATASPDERTRMLRDFVEARFHMKSIRERSEESDRLCGPLRLLGTLQWLFIVIVLPVALTIGMGGLLALLLFATIAFLHVALVLNALRAHRQLHPTSRLGGVGFMLALSPLHAMRSAEHVGRTALLDFDSLAVVLACGEPEDFIALARHAHRELDAAGNAATPRTAAWNALLRGGLDRLLRNARVHHTHLEMPDRVDGSANSYCPRCRTLYALTEGFCADCPGVALRRLNSQQIHDSAAVLSRMKSRQPNA